MADQASEPKLPRVLRRIGGVALTLGVVAGAAVAVGLGAEFLGNRADAQAGIATADPTPVEVTTLTMQGGYSVPRAFVGQVEAQSSVDLSFELGGRLAELPVAEGERVTEGQLLARLDTALLGAEEDRLTAAIEATEAQLGFAESRLRRVEDLRRDGHVSQESMDQARATRDALTARIRELQAGISTVRINLGKSELRAPFDGQVGGRAVDGGETLGVGAVVMTLIETTAPRVRIGLPLTFDTSALDAVRIVVNDVAYPARLAQIRPDIDPVTRTRTALFQLVTENAPVFGQTATLMLDMAVEARGAWVPLDALRESARGGWGVLMVEDSTVRVALVEVLHTTETQAFVSGTFPGDAQMIHTGAHRVVPGQSVRILARAD